MKKPIIICVFILIAIAGIFAALKAIINEKGLVHINARLVYSEVRNLHELPKNDISYAPGIGETEIRTEDTDEHIKNT